MLVFDSVASSDALRDDGPGFSKLLPLSKQAFTSSYGNICFSILDVFMPSATLLFEVASNGPNPFMQSIASFGT